MRVGIDAHLLGKQAGGVERFVREIVLRVPALLPKYEFYIFLNSTEYKKNRLPTRTNVTYVPLLMANPLLERLLVLPWLSHQYALDMLMVQRLLPWFCGKTKLVAVIHDLTPIKYPQAYRGLTNQLVRLLTPDSVKRADLILTPTNVISEEIKQRYGQHKASIEAFFNGVDTTLFTIVTQPKSLLHLNIHKPYLLTTGAIERRKNVETLYRVMAKLKTTQAKPMQLVVVGGVRDKQYAEELDHLLLELGLQNQIVKLGYLDESDLIALYQQAALFITASRDEGFNLPPLEAMACGVDVVCSDIAVHRELFEGCASFFRPDTVDELYSLVNQRLAQTTPDLGFSERTQDCVKKYSWEQTAVRVAHFIKSLLVVTKD